MLQPKLLERIAVFSGFEGRLRTERSRLNVVCGGYNVLLDFLYNPGTDKLTSLN